MSKQIYNWMVDKFKKIGVNEEDMTANHQLSKEQFISFLSDLNRISYMVARVTFENNSIYLNKEEDWIFINSFQLPYLKQIQNYKRVFISYNESISESGGLYIHIEFEQDTYYSVNITDIRLIDDERDEEDNTIFFED